MLAFVSHLPIALQHLFHVFRTEKNFACGCRDSSLACKIAQHSAHIAKLFFEPVSPSCMYALSRPGLILCCNKVLLYCLCKLAGLHYELLWLVIQKALCFVWSTSYYLLEMQNMFHIHFCSWVDVETQWVNSFRLGG